MASTGNIKVIFKILERKKLHPLVHRILMQVVPECLYEQILKRKDHKVYSYNDFLIGSEENLDEAFASSYPEYKPVGDVNSAEWLRDFYLNKGDALWQASVVDSKSLPHIIFMLENCEVNGTVINGILNLYGADEDCILNLLLKSNVPMREYLKEIKSKDDYVSDSVHEKSRDCVVEYDVKDSALLNRIAKGEVQIVREFNPEVMAKVLSDFYAEQKEVYTIIKRRQKISEVTDLFLCWFFAAGYVDFDTFKIFYDVEEEFSPEFMNLLLETNFEGKYSESVGPVL
jgi:adenylate kinase family enzyme